MNKKSLGFIEILFKRLNIHSFNQFVLVMIVFAVTGSLSLIATFEFINAVGASDGRYFSCDDVEIVNFGPGIGSEGHSVNESVEIKKLLESALILNSALENILGITGNHPL